MGLLSEISNAMVVRATRILLLIFALAAVGLTSCNNLSQVDDPLPPLLATEGWPPAPRPEPTPGGMLELPTPEPSALADEAYAILKALTMDHSPRERGTEREAVAALYLQQNLSALGYDSWLQEFDSPHIIWADLRLTSNEGEALMDDGHAHLHPGPLSHTSDSATGLLTLVEGESQGNVPTRGMEGRVALISTGANKLSDQVKRVTDAGAVGAVVLTAEDYLFGELPYGFPTIPVVSVYSGGSHGPALLKLIEQQEVTAAMTVEAEQFSSQNVVANMRGGADNNGVVILGAHYDTVEDTQGASDNGSGVAALLTVARHIAERDYPFDVRIVLFGAEEMGLIGSEHFVENMSRQEIESTIAMLNFDALGSGSTLHAIGDYGLASKALETGREMGAPISLKGGGRASSDHAPFEQVGIPTLFLSSSDISLINSPEDTIEYINPDLIGYAAEIGIAILDSLVMEVRE